MNTNRPTQAPRTAQPRLLLALSTLAATLGLALGTHPAHAMRYLMAEAGVTWPKQNDIECFSTY
jgi:hypothetical protein